MENFSTALLLSGLLALGAKAVAQDGATSGIPLQRAAPQARMLPPAMNAGMAADERRRPAVIVLERQGGPFAEVTGAADEARAGPQLWVAGQLLRVAPASAIQGRYLALYRPGPWLGAGQGRGELGRLAWRVGSANVLRVAPDGVHAEALIVQSSREIAAGDLVLDAPQAQDEPGDAARHILHAVSAKVALQRGPESHRLAAQGQLLAIDRGAADGVRAGMCLRRAPQCKGAGEVVGRVLHAGRHASAAQLAGAGAWLEADQDVCVAPCAD